MYLGIDVGGTNLKSGITDEKGKLLYQYTTQTQAGKGKIAVLRNIHGLIAKAVAKFPRVKSIGIGIGGVVDNDGIIKIVPTMPDWEYIDLAKLLSKYVDLPIFVENDARIAALAEMMVGSCRKEYDFLYLNMGTGISGAIVYDRQIIKGVHGGAGDIGHLFVDMNKAVTKRAIPYQTGNLEYYVGKNNISDYAEKYIKKNPDTILHKYENLDPYFISEAVTKGDKVAAEIFTEVGRILGVGIASALNLLDLNLVVFGGGLAQSHQSLFNSAYETAKVRCLPSIAENLEFRISNKAKESGIIGAALFGKMMYESTQQ